MYVFIDIQCYLFVRPFIYMFIHSLTLLRSHTYLIAKIFKNEDPGTLLYFCFHKAKQIHTPKTMWEAGTNR